MVTIKNYFALSVNLTLGTVALVSVSVVVWCFGLIEGLYAKILLSILIAIVPPLLLMDARKPDSWIRKFNVLIFGSVIISLSFLLIALGAENDSTFLVINSASVIASMLWLWLCWEMSRKSPLLLIATIPTLIAWFIFLAILTVLPVRRLNELSSSTISELDVLLLPLPVVSFTGSILAFFAWRCLVCAKNTRERTVAGPAMESLTMFLLIMPFAALTMLIVYALTGEGIEVALSGLAVGLMFSSAVSTPFRQFLRALGRFDEQQGG